MAKKRKSDATRLDEVDRGMYTTFCTAANSLSQLYTHAMHQQRLSFQAGERHSLNELDYGTEEPPPSPQLPPQQQQTLMPLPHSVLAVSSNAFGPSTLGQGDSVQETLTKPRIQSSQMLSLVQCVGVFSTITYLKEGTLPTMLPVATRTTLTKTETPILSVLMILQWTCIPIALAMILLTRTPSSFFSSG
ncbi:UNVERIFIED_CONTAM: hypothetical protein Sradi_0831100 [Sesamum radiatum]|uniref:Uncharacterized protein n=1 Tax=Sesamum radiatum TaxID=300843 RepID=A0AAW2VSH0_SESRA